MPKQYMLTGPAYLRLKGNPAGDPVYIPSDTIIGEDTPYDFDGPPSLVMSPMTDEAKEEHQRYLESVDSGIPMTVKGGAAQPFDPADPKSDSKAEQDAAKAKAQEDAKRAAELDAKAESLRKQEEDLQKRLKALTEQEAKANQSKPSEPKAPLPDAKK